MALSSADIQRLTTNIDALNDFAEGGPNSSAIMANGQIVPSPLKVITDAKLFKTPLTWPALTLITDATQAYIESDIVYAPQPSLLPFTTGASFTASNWYVLQGLIVSELGGVGVRSFDDVAAMIAATDLSVGDRVVTSGYLAAGDKGGALYLVVTAATGTDDGGEFIDLDSHQAQLVPTDTVTSKQFGAVGNGISDDTTVIQNLINAFDKIIINTESAVTTLFPRSSTNIIIDNVIRTADDVCISLASKTDVTIEATVNGALIGDATSPTQIGIEMNNASFCRLINLKIVSFLLHGIFIRNGSSKNLIEKPFVAGAVHSTGSGIGFQDASVQMNKIVQPICSDNMVGIQIRSSKNNTIDHPLCDDCITTGIQITTISAGDGLGAEHNTIIAPRCNGQTDNTAAGIHITADAKRNLIINPECNNNAGAGIMLKGISGFEPSNNRIDSPVCESNGVNGITLILANDTVISNPTILSNTGNGIDDTDCEGLIISGGVVDNNTVDGINHKSVRTLDDGVTITNNGADGISVSPGGLTSVAHRVVNCHIEGNVTPVSITTVITFKAFNCTGFVAERRGSFDAPDGAIIPHLLSGTPIFVSLTATTPGYIINVTSIDSANVEINIVDDSGSSIGGLETIYFEARLY